MSNSLSTNQQNRCITRAAAAAHERDVRDHLVEESVAQLQNLITEHAQGNRPDLDFEAADMFGWQNDDGELVDDGYASGDEFDNNPSLARLEVEDEEEKGGATLEAYLASRPGKHHANWLPMGLEAPEGLPAAGLKSYGGHPIIEDESSIMAPIDAFDLFINQGIINFLCRKTNQKAAQFLAKENPPKFVMDWVPITTSKFYDFLTNLIFMSLVNLPTERDYFS